MLIHDIIARLNRGDQLMLAKVPNADGTRSAQWYTGDTVPLDTVTIDADTAYEVFLLGLPAMISQIMGEASVD